MGTHITFGTNYLTESLRLPRLKAIFTWSPLEEQLIEIASIFIEASLYDISVLAQLQLVEADPLCNTVCNGILPLSSKWILLLLRESRTLLLGTISL